MKETQIYRINFIQKRGITLDYKHILFIFAGWFVLLVIVTAVQYFRYWNIQRNVALAKVELESLMQDQERRLALLRLTGPKSARSKGQYLTATFEKPPHWSRLMSELKERALPQVKMLQVKSTEDAREGLYRIRMEGEAQSMRAVVEFMQRLQSSPIFRDVALIEAKRSEKNYKIFSYVIDAQLLLMGG